MRRGEEMQGGLQPGWMDIMSVSSSPSCDVGTGRTSASL